MPALLESMFYVNNQIVDGKVERFVPWHKLGTPVETAPCSIEALTLAGLDWTVDSLPVYDRSGKEIPGFIANTRSSDNSVLGIVSNRYKIVQNKDAFDFTDQLLGEGVTYETAGSLKNGEVVWLLAHMPEKYKILDDEFDNYVCFTNSHDGKGAIKCCVTPIRVVCNNTLNLALSQANRMWSTKHMGDIEAKKKEALITLGLEKNYMKALDEEADKMANFKLSDDELLGIFDAMFPIDETKDSARKISSINIMKDNFIKCLQMTDVTPYRNTAYAGILAATDQADHYAPNRMTNDYQLNNWGRIMNGHTYVDTWYNALLKRMK